MSPRSITRVVATAASVALTTTFFMTPAATAADVQYFYAGNAAGHYVDVLGGVVEDGPSASTQMHTTSVPASNSNTLAAVDIAKLLHVEAISTDTATSAIDGGNQVTATAKAAGVRLFDGRIRLNAVTTTSTVKVVNGIASFSGQSELLGLVVNGKKIPVTVSPNTTIEIPGLAKVIINQTAGENLSDAGAKVRSAALEVTLLKDVGDYQKNTVIVLTPTSVSASPDRPSDGSPLTGIAYALQATATVDDAVKVYAGPFARLQLPAGGTAGNQIEKSTVRLNVPNIAKADVLGSTVVGSRDPDKSSSEVSARAASVNLLNGAITVDAVKSTAKVNRAATASQSTSEGIVTIVGLKIGGKPVNIDPQPNTSIDILGLGTLVLNQQIKSPTGIIVRALDLTIGSEGKKLPVGAHLQVATSYAAAFMSAKSNP
jgi:hypothetical protein